MAHDPANRFLAHYEVAGNVDVEPEQLSDVRSLGGWPGERDADHDQVDLVERVVTLRRTRRRGHGSGGNSRDLATEQIPIDNAKTGRVGIGKPAENSSASATLGGVDVSPFRPASPCRAVLSVGFPERSRCCATHLHGSA